MPQDPKPRNWTIDAAPFVVDNDESLLHALAEAASILSRVGGAIVILADREEISPDHWQTTQFRFRWTSFAPGKRLEPPAEPEPDLADAA